MNRRSHPEPQIDDRPSAERTPKVRILLNAKAVQTFDRETIALNVAATKKLEETWIAKLAIE
jgi:hypothetical protein